MPRQFFHLFSQIFKRKGNQIRPKKNKKQNFFHLPFKASILLWESEETWVIESFIKAALTSTCLSNDNRFMCVFIKVTKHIPPPPTHTHTHTRAHTHTHINIITISSLVCVVSLVFTFCCHHGLYICSLNNVPPFTHTHTT